MKMRSMYIKHFRNAFIFGFCVELMIVKTRICIMMNIFKMKILLEVPPKKDWKLKKKKMIILQRVKD